MSAKYKFSLAKLVEQAFKEGMQAVHDDKGWAVYNGLGDEEWNDSEAKKALEKYLKGESQ